MLGTRSWGDWNLYWQKKNTNKQSYDQDLYVDIEVAGTQVTEQKEREAGEEH